MPPLRSRGQVLLSAILLWCSLWCLLTLLVFLVLEVRSEFWATWVLPEGYISCLFSYAMIFAVVRAGMNRWWDRLRLNRQSRSDLQAGRPRRPGKQEG